MFSDSDMMCCVKGLLRLFIFFFIASGIGLIYTGIVVIEDMEPYGELVETNYGGPGILLIIIGAGVLFLSLCGCCGIVLKSYNCTMFFAICLGIIFVLEIAGGFAGFVLQDDIEDEVTKKLNETMSFYSNTTVTEVKKAWDRLQEDFNCCGTLTYTDWTSYSNLTAPPDSCCKQPPCATTNLNDINQEGCSEVFKEFLKDEVAIVGIVGVTVAFLQVVGILFACCLARSIRKEYEIA